MVFWIYFNDELRTFLTPTYSIKILLSIAKNKIPAKLEFDCK